MKVLKIIAAIIPAISLMWACESGSKVGSSLVADSHEIVLDSTFTVTGLSVENHRIQSRTITQVLGQINTDVYGKFTSDFVTQFMSANQIDTTGFTVENVDSLRLIFRIPRTDIVGDSLLPMGLTIYPLVKELPSPIYSDFSPEGYYDPSTVIKSQIYKCNAISEGDTLYNATSKYIDVHLSKELAQKLYTIYKENPDNYSTPQNFSKKFPGFYIKNTYGSGRVVRIAQTVMRLHYHKTFVNDKGRDTTINHVGYYYAVQPEIITNNIIKYQISDELKERVEKGGNILIAPAGRDIEINFPAKSIIESYKSKAGNMAVLNTLTFSIPAKSIENDHGITPPDNLLMILSKDKDKFFIENKMNDDVTSFVASYNKSTQCYDFSLMRNYLLDMMKKEGDLTPEDYTFTITPITLEETIDTNTNYYYYYNTGTTTTVNAIVPYVGAPTMVELDLTKAKIMLTLTKQITIF